MYHTSVTASTSNCFGFGTHTSGVNDENVADLEEERQRRWEEQARRQFKEEDAARARDEQCDEGSANDDASAEPDETDCSWMWSKARRKVKLPPRRHLLGVDVFYVGGRVYIDGYTGGGKSMYTLGLAKAIADQRKFGPWVGCKDGPSPKVLFLDYEMGREQMHRRLKHFASDNLAVVCYDDPEVGEMLPIDTTKGQKQVEKWVKALGADVIIVDNLYAACDGSLLGGADKTGGWQAHEKIVPWTKAMSAKGVLTIWLVHRSCHPLL